MLPGSDPPTLHYHRLLQSSQPQENFLIDLQKCSSPSSSPPPLWCHLQRSLSLPPFSKKFIPPFTAHQIRERCTSTPPSPRFYPSSALYCTTNYVCCMAASNNSPLELPCILFLLFLPLATFVAQLFILRVINPGTRGRERALDRSACVKAERGGVA